MSRGTPVKPGREDRIIKHSLARTAQREASLRSYWNFRSADYEDQTGICPEVYRSVAEYLLREGVFSPGHSVLDVGCGPGTYSLLFAEKASITTAIDVSEGMLSRMMKAAAIKGVKNIRPECTSWEKYRKNRKHDLVFSSFCPAINDEETLLKMEEYSMKSCCLVTSASVNPLPPVYGLWEQLTGEHINHDPADSLYLYNILYYSDRAPSIRLFKYDTKICVPAERLARCFQAYFKMYMELDSNKKEIINDYVRSISVGGLYRTSSREVMGVITWDK